MESNTSDKDINDKTSDVDSVSTKIKKIIAYDKANDYTKADIINDIKNNIDFNQLSTSDIKELQGVFSSNNNSNNNGDDSTAKATTTSEADTTTTNSASARNSSSVSDITKVNDNPDFSNDDDKSVKSALRMHKTSAKERRRRTLARKYHVNEKDLIDPDGDGWKQLNQLIGLDEIKDKVAHYIVFARVCQRAKDLNMKLEPPSLNMIFKGSPGTGKTIVARLVGKILYQYHVIRKPLLHEISASNLNSGIVGGSGRAAKKAVKESLGGILFVDEAHKLAPSKNGDSSDKSKQDALSELIRLTENHRDDLIVILAGYKAPMDRLIQNGDQGLHSRFPNVIMFDDYTDDQMIQILKFHAKRQGFELKGLDDDKETQAYIKDGIAAAKNAKDNSNGRLMRNLLQDVVSAHFWDIGKDTKTIPKLSKDDIGKIGTDDIKKGVAVFDKQESNSTEE